MDREKRLNGDDLVVMPWQAWAATITGGNWFVWLKDLHQEPIRDLSQVVSETVWDTKLWQLGPWVMEEV